MLFICTPGADQPIPQHRSVLSGLTQLPPLHALLPFMLFVPSKLSLLPLSLNSWGDLTGLLNYHWAAYDHRHPEKTLFDLDIGLCYGQFGISVTQGRAWDIFHQQGGKSKDVSWKMP